VAQLLGAAAWPAAPCRTALRLREEVSLAMSADHFRWGNLTLKAVDMDENRV